MNKKGNVVVLLLIVGILFVLFGKVIYDELTSQKNYDQACANIGMKEADYARTIFEQSYCIDNEGIAHKVIFKCEGRECRANLVSVK